MKNNRKHNYIAIALLAALAFTTTIASAAAPSTSLPSTELRAGGARPLPSWNDGKAKQPTVTFVEKVTKRGSPDFVPVPERVAVFDNDGTLWSEQPMNLKWCKIES
jgi:hypothetical protein